MRVPASGYPAQNNPLQCELHHLQELMASPQVEVHPLWRNDDLIQYCNSEGIHVSAYCPLGTPWTSAKAVIRRADPASQHPVIQAIARKHNKHALHIIMRWGLQHGTSILAKSSNPQRIKVGLLRMQLLSPRSACFVLAPQIQRLPAGLSMCAARESSSATLRSLWRPRADYMWRTAHHF